MEHRAPLAREACGVEQGLEGDVLRAAHGLRPVEQASQREPDPRDHHRPPLNAPHPVHSLLQRAEPEHLVQVEHLRLVDHPLDGDGPRPRHEPGCRGGDALLVRRELVEVVVIADLLEGRHRLVGSETLRGVLRHRRGYRQIRKRLGLDRRRPRAVQPPVDCTGRHQAGRCSAYFEERAAIEIQPPAA